MRGETLRAIIHDTARSLIHHGFNRLIFVNGHTSNTKVTDQVFRNLRYETGALLAMFKPYGERYLGHDRGPDGELAGGDRRLARQRAGDLDHAGLQRRQREDGPRRRHPRAGTGLDASRRSRRTTPADVEFKGYEYFYFPMEHNEIAPHGVIGNPMRATAEKGEEIFERFSDHLAAAVEELKKVKVDIRNRRYVQKA